MVPRGSPVAASLGCRHTPAVARALVAAAALALCAAAAAQSSRDRATATTAEAILTYPIFFHAQPVVVLGRIEMSEDSALLASGERRILLAGREAQAAPSGTVEVRGTFFDVGRLSPEDPRLASYRLSEIAQARLGRDRAGPGEILLIQVDSVRPSAPPPAPAIRAIALDPARYRDAYVTVTGRFRGNNLYGDLPNSPGQGRWDFVVRSADAAIWITGLQPRGRGFNLNTSSRVDTARWIEVSGTVREDRGLVWIEAKEMRPAQEPATPVETVVLPVPPKVLTPPEVIFSAPTQDETDVPVDTSVRIQFSRDMDPASFKGRVRVSYLGAEAAERGEPQAPALTFTPTYNPGNRLLEIRFGAPLERFRTMKVELLEGIASHEGAPLKPWTLTFALGG
jgi:hypothetical protein